MAEILKRTLLIIDDDSLFCDSVIHYFSDRAINVYKANTGKDGLSICSGKNVDIVLLDQKLPDAKGINLCQAILEYNDRTKIIFITAYPSYDNVVKALKAGAHDYLSKPFEIEELEVSVSKASRTIDLELVEQVQYYKNKKESSETVLIGENSGLSQVNRLVDLASETNSPVLITGETGTGKSVVAKMIHYRKKNVGSAFISINCAALPENLIEAELFGYEKGAFTGALQTKKGIFEMAEGGTLFLDELGELPFHLQSKLLSVLDEKKVMRLGGSHSKPVNVRIIAATNVSLEKAIRDNKFRKDLFYRLNVLRIHIPPLIERLEDLPELCNFFVHQLEPSLECKIPEDEFLELKKYSWPGNVRDLRNAIERSIILREGNILRPSAVLDNIASVICKNHDIDSIKNTGLDFTLSDSSLIELTDVEKEYIGHVLKKLNNNRSKSADVLGISRSTLIRKIKEYGLI